VELIEPLDGGRPAPFDEQSTVNEQLFARLNGTQRVEIDATALLLRLAVGRAAVVHPARRISAGADRCSRIPRQLHTTEAM
jgi:hypothetical protein